MIEKAEGCVIVKDLGIINIYKKRTSCWLCRCRCGFERPVIKSDWDQLTGLCKKCKNRKYVGEISGSLFSELKYKAKVRGLEFDLEAEYIWELFLKQNRKCAYTRLDLIFGNGDKERNNVRTASLDRINNSKGYLVGNVHWIHEDINYMKHILSEERFFFLCRLITENNYEKNINSNRSRGELLHSIIVGPCSSIIESSGSILGRPSKIAA